MSNLLDPLPRRLLSSLHACRIDRESCRLCGGFPSSTVKDRAGLPSLDGDLFWEAIDALDAAGLVKFCGTGSGQSGLECYCLSASHE